ncbi:MAG TPA: hypothetical protein PKK69_03655, partial [Ferruginibacter sp.]|nr:hypothetical protein [Ferruginibacter sp.]
FYAGITINNHGQFIVSGNNEDAGTNNVLIHNYGTFLKTSSGTTSLTHLFQFNNTGTVQCNNGNVIINSTINNSGLVALTGGNLQFNGNFNQNNGSSFSGTGILFNQGGNFNLQTTQQWPAGFQFQQEGDVLIPNGVTLSVQGPYHFLSGTITGPGSLEINSNGSLNLETSSSKKIQNSLQLNNLGEMNWKQGDLFWGAGVQTITNAGTFRIGEAGISQVLNTHAQPGLAIINNQQELFQYTSAAVSLASVTLNNASGKTIRGIGRLNVDYFNNNGILEVGHPVGSFTVNGAQPFSATSLLKIDLTGPTLGSGYDVFNGNAGAALNLTGSLQVIQTGELPNGSYGIIYSGSGFSGNFNSVELPDFCSLQITATDVIVVRNGPTTGDYRTKANGDWESSLVWERFNGTQFVAANKPGLSAGNISIQHNISITSGGITEADQVSVEALGTLNIRSRLMLNDGAGDDLQVRAGGMLLFDNGGKLSGTGNIVNDGLINIQGRGTIAIPCTNNGGILFNLSYEGCCITGTLYLADDLTTGRIDNYGSMIISASGGVYDMNILYGEIYNHTNAVMQVNYKTNIDVNKFTNEGEFTVGVSGVTEAVCTIKSAQSTTHSGGRFKSNGNSMQLVMQTNGTITYAANCSIDANIHYSTGIHEVFSTNYGKYDSRISTTVNFGGSLFHFPGNVFVDAGNFGGPAIKRIGGSLIWPSGTISGGNLLISDTATAELGAGQNTQGNLNTTLLNQGTVHVTNGYGGCCSSPELNMTNGIIENQGQFIFTPSYGGGIRNVTLSGGTFHNNSNGTLINNATAASSYGDNEIYLRNTVFNNEGTVLANGISLNIFPTTDPVIHGTITVAQGAQVKFGLPATTTTFAPDAVIQGAGRVYFF